MTFSSQLRALRQRAELTQEQLARKAELTSATVAKLATDRGDFKAILCWDQDRFGRFDSMDAGYWTYPIREAGVELVTVTDGPIDWNDFAGRIIYTVKQEGKHQFLRDLSSNVLRGQHE